MADHQDEGPDTGPPLRLVLLETYEGREAVIYGPGPEYAEVGILFAPAELLAEES
ncbi:hypothetical protein [Streptomyces halobius]|uniref:Uncharacterized protein n=1 Tax=Streptomyces halobius TaxID=2879846 RepID=A0ABY4MCX9_9ACTN|nr:hypothetical protein [Streptomyces halobius]UQA95629.1 hypothetical protein K9S39_30575 [Streptomyces halobius]